MPERLEVGGAEDVAAVTDRAIRAVVRGRRGNSVTGDVELCRAEIANHQ